MNDEPGPSSRDNAFNPPPPLQEPSQQEAAPVTVSKLKRPLWKKKRFIFPAGILLLGIGAATGGGGNQAPALSSEATATPAAGTASPSPSPSTPKPTPTKSTPRPTRTPTPTPTPAKPAVPSMHFEGVGDMVVPLTTPVTSAAVVTFSCPACTSNTVLKSNGRESLLVNEIGAYPRGERLIGAYDNSLTTEFVVKANGAWAIDILDAFALTPVEGPVSGGGDKVLLYLNLSENAAIQNIGEGNFVVKAIGSGSSSPLIVNEIGSYQGTVKLPLPALVEVTSSGSWSITPQ